MNLTITIEAVTSEDSEDYTTIAEVSLEFTPPDTLVISGSDARMRAGTQADAALQAVLKRLAG